MSKEIEKLTTKRAAIILEDEGGKILDGYEQELDFNDDIAYSFMENIVKRNWQCLCYGDKITIQEGCYLDKDDHRIIHCNETEYYFSSENAAINYIKRMRAIRDKSTAGNVEGAYLQFKVMPCEDRRNNDYTVVYANHQFWLYNEDRHEFIDVPLDVLNEIKDKFGDDQQTYYKNGEDYLDKLVKEQKPDWLNDIEYIFDGDMQL